MIEKIVDVGKEFSRRLIYRNAFQANDNINAQNFRRRFLSELDSFEKWGKDYRVVLDFSNVDTISPGFANEAFAYFAKYAKTPAELLEKIFIKNASGVKDKIILDEINSGFR